MPLTPAASAECAFAEGDRVQERYGWLQHGRDGESSAKRWGRVAAVTRRPPNGRGEAGWAITVRWDGDAFDAQGYTGAGLVKVFVLPPVCLPGVSTGGGPFDELNKITLTEIDNENRRLLKRLVEIVPAPQVKS